MEKLLKILCEIRPDFDFTKSNDFIADGLLDSFDMVLLVAKLEEVFGISINGADIIPDNFYCLDRIKTLVEHSGGIL